MTKTFCITSAKITVEWAQRKVLLLVMVSLGLFHSLAAEIPEHPQLASYLILDAEEERYSEYRDSPEILNIKLYQLDTINESRAQYKVPAVELDILASRVANRMAREACEGGFHGHWNLRGEKPYHRWAFAGGTAHVAENAAAMWSSANLATGLNDMLQNMRRSHQEFMAEPPGSDGHKQNCIGKFHNYVGLGVALVGRHFRYYEEYIDRYLEFELPTETIKPNRDFTLRFRSLREDKHPYAVAVYYEHYPSPISAAAAQRKGSYPDYTNRRFITLWPWDLPVGEDGWCQLTLNVRWRGLYYMHVYLADERYSGRGNATTTGKIQASGVVLHVP